MLNKATSKLGIFTKINKPIYYTVGMEKKKNKKEENKDLEGEVLTSIYLSNIWK